MSLYKDNIITVGLDMEQILLHVSLSFSAEEGAYGWFILQCLYLSFCFLC